jgi:heptose I phosphotransferase
MTTWHVQADPDWKKVVPADPEAVLALESRDRFHAKQGRSIARWSPSPNLTVYLKRHYQESWWRGWLSALTRRPNSSAAWQEHQRLRRAAAEGFVVPRPVAVGVGIGPNIQLRGYLAVEELYGMLPLHELIPLAQARLPATRFAEWKRGLLGELARIAKLLHDRRYFHKDFYLCHFYAAESSIAQPSHDWTGRLAMIDLHRFARHPLTWRWWQLKDLAQLLYSTHVAGITAKDRVRFWKLYAGPGRNCGIGPWVRRLILVRWNNYRGHNQIRHAA